MLRAADQIEGSQGRVDGLRTDLDALKELGAQERRYVKELPDVSKEQTAGESALAAYQRVKARIPAWRALRKIKQEGGKSREYANDDLRWFSGIKARLNLVSELLGGTRFYVEEASARGKKVLIMFKGGHWPHHGEMIFVRSEVDPVISQLSAPLEGLRKWDQEYGVGVIKAAEAEQARLRQVLADAHGYNTHGGKGNSVLFPEDFAALTAEINGLAADKELATAAGDVHQGPFGLSSDNLRVSGFWPEVRWISPHRSYRQSPPVPMPRSRPRRHLISAVNGK